MVKEHRFDNRDRLYEEASELVARIGKDAIDKRSRFTFALSGGKSPLPLYNILSDPEYKHDINWNLTHLFWSDERYVPPKDKDSNYNHAYNNLISKIDIKVKNIHKIETGISPPESAARDYENKLVNFFPESPPVFDLILLGIGNDGHIASIFPNDKLIREEKRFVISTEPIGSPKVKRVTLTLPVINAARNVILLAPNKNKGAIVHKILKEPDISLALFPAALVYPRGQLHWFILK